MRLDNFFGLTDPIVIPHPLYLIAGAAVAAFLLAKDLKHALMLAMSVCLLLMVLKK
jgi:hypothetical protein